MGPRGVAVWCRAAVGDNPEHHLAVDFLFRVRSGEFGLSDGERDLSARDPGAGDCLLLRARHGAIGGGLSPLLFGWLIGAGSSWMVSIGHLIAALLLLVAAVTEWKLGIDAEGRSLEEIASPLSRRRRQFNSLASHLRRLCRGGRHGGSRRPAF